MSIQSATTVAANAAAQLPGTGVGGARQNAPASSAAGTGNTAQGSGTAPSPSNVQEISAALQEIQNAIRPIASELSFSLEQDSGRMLVKIVDLETDEVIRQIPSEEMVRISKALDKLQGLLLNSEA